MTGHKEADDGICSLSSDTPLTCHRPWPTRSRVRKFFVAFVRMTACAEVVHLLLRWRFFNNPSHLGYYYLGVCCTFWLVGWL